MKSKKIENIIIFVLIALFLASNILIRKITNLDELWNYNFASNIANGLVPYRDFNMIITPLLSILCGIILKITGKYLIIFRILNILLNTLNVFMAYKIMEQLKIKKYIRYIVLMTTVYIFKDYAMMDYNYGITLITLITVYLEIKNNDNQNIYYNFFIGVLTG